MLCVRPFILKAFTSLTKGLKNCTNQKVLCKNRSCRGRGTPATVHRAVAHARLTAHAVFVAPHTFSAKVVGLSSSQYGQATPRKRGFPTASTGILTNPLSTNKRVSFSRKISFFWCTQRIRETHKRNYKSPHCSDIALAMPGKVLERTFARSLGGNFKAEYSHSG